MQRLFITRHTVQFVESEEYALAPETNTKYHLLCMVCHMGLTVWIAHHSNSVFSRICIALANGDVVYSYLMYPDKNMPFLDCDGRGGTFLGMSIVLPGIYLRNTDKLDKFFQEFCKKYIDNQIVSTRPNGVRQFLVSRLGTPQMEKYITNALNKFVRERPDLNFTESAAHIFNANPIHDKPAHFGRFLCQDIEKIFQTPCCLRNISSGFPAFNSGDTENPSASMNDCICDLICATSTSSAVQYSTSKNKPRFVTVSNSII